MGSEHSECIIASVLSGVERARGLYIHALRNYSCAYLELRRTLRYGDIHMYIARKIGPLRRLGQLPPCARSQ